MIDTDWERTCFEREGRFEEIERVSVRARAGWAAPKPRKLAGWREHERRVQGPLAKGRP